MRKQEQQITLPAAREIAAAVAQHRDRIDAERVTLAWKSARAATFDFGGGPLFDPQGQLFDARPEEDQQ